MGKGLGLMALNEAMPAVHDIPNDSAPTLTTPPSHPHHQNANQNIQVSRDCLRASSEGGAVSLREIPRFARKPTLAENKLERASLRAGRNGSTMAGIVGGRVIVHGHFQKGAFPLISWIIMAIDDGSNPRPRHLDLVPYVIRIPPYLSILVTWQSLKLAAGCPAGSLPAMARL